MQLFGSENKTAKVRLVASVAKVQLESIECTGKTVSSADFLAAHPVSKKNTLKKIPFLAAED